jgi:hypothetical protein
MELRCFLMLIGLLVIEEYKRINNKNELKTVRN